MRKPEESWETYIYRKQGHGTYVKLRGVKPFNELLSKGIITPYLTTIRIMYTGLIDMVYKVNGQGRLVDIKRGDIYDKNCLGADPKDVLPGESDKYWWEVEDIKPQGYDERRKT